MSENQALKQDQPQKIKIDPLVLFQQFEQLRKEGVDEETLRTAIAELMDQSKGNYRHAKPAMMQHIDAPPVPNQKEINKIYEDQVREININPHMHTILDAIQKKEELRLKTNSLLKNRIKIYIMKKTLPIVIPILQKLGVK